MRKSLQYQFVESQGSPVVIGEWEVIQCGRIFIADGLVRLRFLSEATGKHGVALKAKKGCIEMTNGTVTQRLNIWHEKELPPSVEHRVECPTGELMVWNIYRVRHPDGSVTEEEWTGNAGMVLLDARDRYRRYGCSNSLGDFSPNNLEFEIEWETVG